MEYLIALFATLAMLSPLFLIGFRKYTGKRAKHALIANLSSFAGFMMLAVIFGFSGSASAADTTAASAVAAAASDSGISAGLKYIGAGLAVGLSGIGGGIAVASSAAAALGAISENEKAFGKSLIFVGLAEGVALYGLIVALLLLFN
jgi:V/A-type H+-transporting ATPase subunit K